MGIPKHWLVMQRHLTVLHLVPHTTCRWLSHCEANTLLSRPRENSLSLRMPGSLPAAKPRRLRWSRNSCCCWGLNSRPRRAHTTERRLHHHCWAWRDEQETRLRLCGAWHQPSWWERAKKDSRALRFHGGKAQDFCRVQNVSGTKNICFVFFLHRT